MIVDPKAPPVRINVTMSAARTRTGPGGGTSTVEVRPRVTGTVDSPLAPAVTQYLNRAARAGDRHHQRAAVAARETHRQGNHLNGPPG
ncbi:hypothetical protein ACU686_41350 [Yinghuangia aomiensis]